MLKWLGSFCLSPPTAVLCREDLVRQPKFCGCLSMMARFCRPLLDRFPEFAPRRAHGQAASQLMGTFHCSRRRTAAVIEHLRQPLLLRTVDYVAGTSIGLGGRSQHCGKFDRYGVGVVSLPVTTERRSGKSVSIQARRMLIFTA